MNPLPVYKNLKYHVMRTAHNKASKTIFVYAYYYESENKQAFCCKWFKI